MYTATITSKRQFTIPVELFRRLNFEISQKVLVSEMDGSLKIQPASLLVEKLAGSVTVPSRLKGKNVDEIVQLAKKEYFQRSKQI